MPIVNVGETEGLALLAVPTTRPLRPLSAHQSSVGPTPSYRFRTSVGLPVTGATAFRAFRISGGRRR